MTQRLLARLRRRGLVAMRPRVIGGPEFGEGRPTYHLSADGARLGRTSWPGMPARRLRSYGAFLGRHALSCAEVILAFQRSAAEAVDHELVSWECDWQAALPLGPTFLIFAFPALIGSCAILALLRAGLPSPLAGEGGAPRAVARRWRAG